MNTEHPFYRIPKTPKSDATDAELYEYAKIIATGNPSGQVLYLQLSKNAATAGLQPDMAVVHFSMRGIPFRVDRFNIPKLLEERRKYFWDDLWKGNIK